VWLCCDDAGWRRATGAPDLSMLLRYRAARCRPWKTLQRNAKRRIPTTQEFLAFDGAHCRRIYARLDISWQCPACRQNKYQLMRWTMRFPNLPTRFEGWAVGLDGHHNHEADLALNAGNRSASDVAPRFQTTILCGQCNAADATAKRKLKLPERFTFSPAEIGMFVTATPHGWHLVDYKPAAILYTSVQTTRPATGPVFWPPTPTGTAAFR
jgi:hypothetical protein